MPLHSPVVQVLTGAFRQTERHLLPGSTTRRKAPPWSEWIRNAGIWGGINSFLLLSVYAIGIYKLLHCSLEKAPTSKNTVWQQWDVQTCPPTSVLVRKSLSWEKVVLLSDYQLLCFKYASKLSGSFWSAPRLGIWCDMIRTLHSSSGCTVLSQLCSHTATWYEATLS